MEALELKSPIALQVKSIRTFAVIEEEHHIPCRKCNYGLVKNWFGASRICPACNGTASLGTFKTTRVVC